MLAFAVFPSVVSEGPHDRKPLSFPNDRVL